MMKSLSWWKYRVTELVVALMATACVIYLADNISDRRKAAVAATNWFVVNKIFVPNHMANSNPIMTYDRTIKVPFRGFWVTEVQRRVEDGSFTLECSASGINDYDVGDYIPDNQVRWKWFVDRCSVLPVGTYRLRSSWVMRKPEWPDKQFVTYSNIFNVQ